MPAVSANDSTINNINQVGMPPVSIAPIIAAKESMAKKNPKVYDRMYIVTLPHIDYYQLQNLCALVPSNLTTQPARYSFRHLQLVCLF